jgi:hypothetical protein
MKSLPALLAFALLLTLPLRAQETPERLPAPSALPAEVPLIPEEVPQNAKPRGSAITPADRGVKTSKTDVSAAELRERIRFREAKTKALRDAQVQAQWERSVQARTDYERREALKSYYKLLYARIGKLDSSIKKLIEERQQYSLRRLEQDRIDPTVPFDPGE